MILIDRPGLGVVMGDVDVIVVHSSNVDSLDAPYSVVVPLRTTDGIPSCFWREFMGYPF